MFVALWSHAVPLLVFVMASHSEVWLNKPPSPSYATALKYSALFIRLRDAPRRKDMRLWYVAHTTTLLHHKHIHAPNMKEKSRWMGLPVMFSCLGQIPREDVDKQSSSSGVTWTPTSTGLEALLSSPCEGEGGLSTALSMHKVPLHCFLLCSMKIRMSPKGKFIWHWPQVSRSWSPSGATCTSPRCSCLSSETTADRGSAARRKNPYATQREWKTEGILETECNNERRQDDGAQKKKYSKSNF